MSFGQFNIGFTNNLQLNNFSFFPMQNTISGAMGNIFGFDATQSSFQNFTMPTVLTNEFFENLCKNQAQLQQMMMETIRQIMSNPLINHTPTEDIQNNFRPYDYNKYNIGTLDVSEASSVSSAGSPYSAVSDLSAYGTNAQKISQLTPEMQEKTMQLLDFAKANGLKVQITSGYRTQEEQQELLRTRPQFAAKRSAHCEGKAIDIHIVGGTDADYKLLGDFAKSIGMRWGGDFSSVKERWHFDYQWA